MTQTITIEFPNKETLVLDVTYVTSKTPPTNKLNSKSLTFGGNNDFTVTLTPRTVTEVEPNTSLYPSTTLFPS
jgi:hypothetical protein